MYGGSFAQDSAGPIPSAPSQDTKQFIRDLTAHCNAYKGGSVGSAVFQLATTTALYFATLALMVAAYKTYGWLASLPFIVLAAGLLVRLFIVQHDCGHGSFFPSRRLNEITGRFVSLLTFTPYDFWRRAHNIHHAGSGNLNRRSVGSIDTLTVREYKALPESKQRTYRLYRNPYLLLLLGTPFYILLLQRVTPMQGVPYLEEYHTVPRKNAFRSVMALNAALALVYGTAAFFLGWQPVVLCYIPVVIITSWIGGWLFYIQHQFEDAYWQYDKDWSYGEAAVLGSSYYHLPKVLQWFTGNIGLHHIHHLCSGIPNYRLQECMDDRPELANLNRMTLSDSLKCLNWALWDEDKGKMVSFREAQAA